MIEVTVPLYAVVTTERIVRDIAIFITDVGNNQFSIDPNGLRNLPNGRYRARGLVQVDDKRLSIDYEITLSDT